MIDISRILHADRNAARRPRFVQLVARRKSKVAAVALADKNACMELGDDGQRRTLAITLVRPETTAICRITGRP